MSVMLRKVVLVFLGIFFPVMVFADDSGILSYPEALKLNSPTTGVVIQVAALGKYYRKSELLVGFDNSIIKSQIKVLKLQQQLQQKILAEAKREFDRSEELYEGTMLSTHELKLAEIALLKEQLQLQKLKSRLVEKRWQLKHYQLKAPFDGFVVEVFIFSQQYIVNRLNTQPLLKFIAADDIKIDLLLAKNKMDGLKQGDIFAIGENHQASFISIKDKMLRLKLKGLADSNLKLIENGSRVNLRLDN